MTALFGGWRSGRAGLLALMLLLGAGACTPRDLLSGGAAIGSEAAAGAERTAAPAPRTTPAGPAPTPSASRASAPAAAPTPRASRAGAAAVPTQALAFSLTILHSSDGESRLLGGDDGFGGAARFASLVQRLRAEAAAESDGVIVVSAGDNFLSGPEFDASLAHGRHYDAAVLDIAGYDAIALGNHEFDYGPEVAADFIASFRSGTPFLSANLDVSAEPRLAALAAEGRLSGRTVLDVNGEAVGVIGVTTPDLPFLASPRRAAVSRDLAGVIQAEVQALTAAGVNKIVLLSHLQSVRKSLELAAELRGVDVIVSGGGVGALANPGDRLIPGDEAHVFGRYPLLARDADGVSVPVAAGIGGYRYVGRLVVTFDAAGRLLTIDTASGPVRVAGEPHADASAQHARVLAEVIEPVRQFQADLSAAVVARLGVPLDGQRHAIRMGETNQGNLIADAMRWQAAQSAAAYGAPAATVALQNSGGIRNDAVIPPGELTALDVYAMLPFPDFVTIAAGLSAADFKAVMENAVSRVEFVDGRFPQISGFRVVYDPDAEPRVVDENGVVTSAGSRIVSITLDDGTPIVVDGEAVDGAPVIHAATVNFLARGGDQYPYEGFELTVLGVRATSALTNYVREVLGGSVTADRYPAGGDGRMRTLAEAAAE